MPTLKNWLQTESDSPPPFSPDPAELDINRRQMRSLLRSTDAPQAPAELTPLQLARAYGRSGRSPRQIYKLIKQGIPVPRLANALGLAPELIQEIVKREQAIARATGPARQAVKLYESGLTFPQIGEKLQVSETEARNLYARGHVGRYGANPAVQVSQREGTAFPQGVFEQPTYLSDTNRGSPVIANIIGSLRKQLEPQGYMLETFFEADAMGGRHVVKLVKDGEMIGQPFRLTATPSGAPLISKTGKAGGGYRLTQQGRGTSLDERLGAAALQMAANYNADQVRRAARASAPQLDDDTFAAAPDWLNESPLWDDEPNFNDSPLTWDNEPPPPSPPWEQAAALSGPAGPVGDANGRQNVLDLLEVNAKHNENLWRQISAADFMRLSHAGRFREENAESLLRDPKSGQFVYPEGLAGYTPIVSKGTVYPLQARNYIAGNIELEDGRQWGSQAKMGKQLKRDELSLTRKYWQAGPALGVAYHQTPQHILGQRAEQPELAYTARAFILDRGGIIPEGQMWKDTSYAPWVFGSFEQAPEKYELRFDPNYSETEVLAAAGLLGPDGKFRPRVLRHGDKVAAPNGFSKDLLRNNEAGVINGYEIAESLNERGELVKALRFKGYFGNRPNVVSAMKLEGWKNLAQDKHIRQGLGINADIITNKPSDSVVANISMLNALPRSEFEDLWREVHGDSPAPTRTGSMSEVEALAPVWQRLQEKNRATEIFRDQVVDADTLKNYLDAGIVKDNKYEELPPLFEGAEPQYKLDLIASGYYAPVRTNFVTDVTNLRRGHLSNEILRNVERNFPGLGEHLRDLGYRERDIYNTLFEMHQLNTKPGYSEHGSPVVDLIGDLTGNSAARAGMQALYEQKLQEILPESMAGLNPTDYTEEQQRAYRKFKNEAGAQAIRHYYDDALGSDSYIFRLDSDNASADPSGRPSPKGDQEAAYMVNPGLVERFGYIDEETNERLSQLKNEGDYQLKTVWEAVQSGQPGDLSGRLKKLPGRMQDVTRNQTQLLASVGARKKWFGTSDSSIFTHVHASDYALPRNGVAASWADIFRMTGLKRTKANQARLNKLSQSGQLLFSGIRNPASDPVAQTGTILNMLTPDILKAAGLDIPTTGHPILFHPHQVQRQGGDNDSDESQVYMVLQKMAGELVNSFGLTPTDPALITAGARRHAAGEYADAVEKLSVSEAKARQNLLGFDPTQPALELAGSRFSPEKWTDQTLADYQANTRQIGQAYNIPIRVGLNLAKNPAAQAAISEYGGWLYQNPLDKVNYPLGSPEEDLFKFFTSFDAMLGSFAGSDHDLGRYYSFRPSAGFKNRGQFGAAGVLAILKRLNQKREGTQAQVTPEQMAGFMAGSNTGPIDPWSLPEWGQLNTQAIKGLKLNPEQQQALQAFAGGDSALAQMMRGYAVRTGLKSAARMQRKLQEEMQDPANWAGEGSPNSNQFKGNLRNYLNVFQNEMYRYGQGIGSTEFKRDYEKFNALFGQSSTSNWFNILEPGSKDKAPGEFYNWPVEKRQKFYKLTGRLLQKHVTGYGRDENNIWRNLDPSVARNNPYFKEWYADYDRIRDVMAVNAQERGEDIEGYAPSLEELGRSEVTGPLVREKYTRKQKLLGGLGRLFETFKSVTGLTKWPGEANGQAEMGQDFENFVAGKKPYTSQEAEMFRQADLGHQEASELRARERKRQGYEEPMYFAEGGVLNRPTKLGETRGGRDVVGGEAGREYVVPEGKTQDLGGGLKLFDTDQLGQGAPGGSKPVMLAKGGILDYQEYADALPQPFEDALMMTAIELAGVDYRNVTDVNAAKDIVRRQIEADIQKMAAKPPQNGLPGLMASSMSGRATELMARSLGPNPQGSDLSAWNELLGEYGLSADVQPLGVNPRQIDPAIKKQLLQEAGGDSQAYKTALTGYMQQLNSQLAGKGFSHTNYGNVYNAIPGWQGYWNGNRPASTVPAVALSGPAQGNLARLMAWPLRASLRSSSAGLPSVVGGGGQPPQEPGAPASSGAGGGEQRGKEIVAYAQPFSPQTVEMYKTLSEKLSKYADTIEELNLNGATLAEVSGEAAQVIKAAGKTYQRLEGQYSRAQRVIRYDALQNKFDAFQYRQGEALSDEESREFAQLQEQMVKPTGADISASMKVKGYIQDVFPVYAERELAGRRGTRLPRQMIANSPLAWAAQIAGRDPGLVREARQAERQALRLSQVDQRLGDIRDFYAASGSGRAEAFRTTPQQFDDAAQVSFLSSQRQSAYEAAVPLKRQFDEAQNRGDLGTAQRLWDQIDPLNTRIGELKDQIGILTPHLKEHIDTLGEQTGVIRDDLKERKATYSALAAKEKALQAEKIDLSGAARLAKAAEIGVVRSEMDTVKGEIKSQARRLGQKSYEKETLSDLIHEPQGRAITGLGSRPQTYGQMAMSELKKGYDPQRLFWQFQNMQQLQYMAFMPMLNMRSQYLGEQAALGQANYALGAGSMPESVLSAMAAQANMSRAQSSFGRGVDNSIAMNAWRGFTGFLGQNEGAGSFLGAAGFDLTSGLTAAMGLKMVAGPAVSAFHKLAGGLGVKSAPYLLPGGGPGLAATTGAAALGGGGLVAGGLGAGLGLGINEYLAGQNAGGNILGLDWKAVPFGQHATVAAYGLGGADIRAEDIGTMGMSWAGRRLGEWLGTGQTQFWNQEKAEAAATAVGKYTGAVTDPIPVWITKIEGEVARQLGVSSDELPFDRTELAQMVQMAAEDQGLTKKQLEESPGVAAKLAAEIADSYKSGVSMSQSSGLRQRAIEVSGYAPGTEGSRMMSDWVKQGSLFERQQRLGAGAMVQNMADQMDFSPEQRQAMSQKVYELLSSGVSQNQVSRSLQQAGMGNQYYWSAAAYESGNPALALFDQAEPWRPKYQADTWAIEDRRRGEDNRREWGRAETQLGWQSQSMKLDETAWNLNRRQQLDDFNIGQKFFDFQIKQMRYGLDREEQQSQMSNRYQERQYQTNRQMFDLQTTWQRADFDKQEQRLATNRAWQLEDFAWGREGFELQTDWQQEDLSRALRYASGRERMDIRRKMERSGILADRQRTEMDREEGRAEVKHDWAEDDLATARRRFEELRPLQEEQMAMGRQYWEEQKTFAEEDRALRKQMTEEQIALMVERNELNKNQFYESRELAEQNHTLELQMANQKLEWATADLKLARERAAEDEKMLGWQREMTLAQQQYAAFNQMGYEWSVKHLPVLQSMLTAAQQLSGLSPYGGKSPAGGSTEAGAAGGGSRSKPAKMSFAEGGPVPETGLALVHQNEYVVPQHGALVMRDESLAQGVQRTNELLSAILQAVASKSGTVDLGQIVEGIVAGGFNQTYRVG